ncbi:MAG: CHAT domain-containing protein [Desulfomonilaceae bacterium]
MALSSDNQCGLPNARICWLLSLTGTLALLLCLFYPDGSEGFSPSSETPRVKTGQSVVSPPTPAPARCRGTVESGVGTGTKFRPGVPALQRTLIRERQLRTGQPGDDSKVIQPHRSRNTQTPPQQLPARKLAKPRVPYLTELAVDIDRSLADRVLQQPAAVEAIYKNSLSLAKKGGNVLKEEEAAINLGHVSYLTGRFPEAVASYSEALLISRGIGDKSGEATALRNLAASFTAAGNFNEAEQYNSEALTLLQASGSARDLQMVLNNLGVLEKNQAKYSRALNRYESALEMQGESEDVRALLHRNLGNFFRLWGEYGKAAQNYEVSATLWTSLGNGKEAGSAILDKGQVYAQWGRNESAFESTQKAIQTLTNAGAPTDWSKKLMGDLLLDTGRLSEAEPYIKDADYDSSLGWLYLLGSQPQVARKHYEQLLRAAQNESNLDELFVAHTGLAKALEAMKSYDEARHHYAKGVEIAEEIRSKLLLSERKNFFAAKISGFVRSEPAKGLLRISLKQKRPEQSIYPGEVIRAREFADSLSQRAEGRHFNVPVELIEQEAALTDQLASLKTALPIMPKTLDDRRYAELTGRIANAETQRKRLVKDLCENYKDYCAVRYPSPVVLEQADIRPDEYILLFDTVTDGIAIRLLKGRKVVKSSLLEWNAQDMDRAIRRFREPFEQVQLSKFPIQLAKLLHDRLTADALESVPVGAPIVIIPDGVLALLPFEALVTGGTPIWKSGQYGDFPQGINYLGDRNPIVYSQSLTSMTLVRKIAKKEKAGSALLVMADPVFEMTDERARNAEVSKPVVENKDHCSRVKSAMEGSCAGSLNFRRLPQTRELSNSLKELYGDFCEIYTDFQCTKKAFLDSLSKRPGQYGSIVFGTHGFAANDLPGIMEPVLALSMVPEGTDGFLTMTEIAGLKMNADVAALTACKTGLGARLEGEGIMSLGRSFQIAGARSVIMSLWSVAEEPSTLLMYEFFKGLHQGLGKNQAWIRSRAELRNQGFEHPFFWAPFILMGEKD